MKSKILFYIAVGFGFSDRFSVIRNLDKEPDDMQTIGGGVR